MRGQIAAIAVLATGITAVTPATSAHATDGITQNAIGTYAFGWDASEPSGKWALTPCDIDAPRCVRINRYRLTDTAMTRPVFVGTAFWEVGSWTMVSEVTDLINCKETGEKYDFTATWSWDAASNEGSRSYINPGLCGGDSKGNAVSVKFYLHRLSDDTPASAAAPSSSPPPPAAPPSPAAPAPEPAVAAVPAAPPAPAPGAAESSAPPPAA